MFYKLGKDKKIYDFFHKGIRDNNSNTPKELQKNTLKLADQHIRTDEKNLVLSPRINIKSHSKSLIYFQENFKFNTK